MGSESKNSIKVPASSLYFSANAEIGSNGANAKTAPIKILARTNTVVNDSFGRVLHDLSSCQHRARIPLDWCHDDSTPIGFINKIDASDDGIICSGSLVSTRPDDRCAEIIRQHEAGIPFEASVLTTGNEVEYLDEGDSGMVNGQVVEGPLYVLRNYRLRGVALCLYGRDPNTTSQFSLGDSVEMSVVPFKTNAFGQNLGESKTIKDVVMSESVKAEGDKPVDASTVQDKSADGVDKPADAEGKKDVEGGTTPPVETPETEGDVKPVEVEQTEVPTESKLTEGRRFLDAFGSQGAVWFCEGKTYDQCVKLHLDALKAENAELKLRLSQVAGGAAPVSFSESPEVPDEERQLKAKEKKLRDSGMPPSIAQLMTLIGDNQ